MARLAGLMQSSGGRELGEAAELAMGGAGARVRVWVGGRVCV